MKRKHLKHSQILTDCIVSELNTLIDDKQKELCNQGELPTCTSIELAAALGTAPNRLRKAIVANYEEYLESGEIKNMIEHSPNYPVKANSADTLSTKFLIPYPLALNMAFAYCIRNRIFGLGGKEGRKLRLRMEAMINGFGLKTANVQAMITRYGPPAGNSKQLDLSPGEIEFSTSVMPDQPTSPETDVAETIMTKTSQTAIEQSAHNSIEAEFSDHPGIILHRDYIQTGQFTKERLAEALDVSYATLNSVTNCNQPISPTLAVRLEMVLGVSANYWMGLQQAHDVSIAKETQRSFVPVNMFADIREATSAYLELKRHTAKLVEEHASQLEAKDAEHRQEIDLLRASWAEDRKKLSETTKNTPAKKAPTKHPRKPRCDVEYRAVNIPGIPNTKTCMAGVEAIKANPDDSDLVIADRTGISFSYISRIRRCMREAGHDV